jgi:hypothetical protein
MRKAITEEHPSGLTLRAQLAVEHYLVHGEQLSAYRHGFGQGKARERVYSAMVRRFFLRPRVIAEIKRRRERISQMTDITVERIVRRLEQFAFADLPGIANFDGVTMTCADFAKLTPQQRAAIKKFEFQRDPPIEHKDSDGNVLSISEGETKFRVELEDRVTCTIKLGQHIGMWEKKRQAITDVPLFNLITVPAAVPAGK